MNMWNTNEKKTFQLSGDHYLAYLVVWGEFHGRHAVDVLLDLGEQIVPASDQATLVLVVDQLQLIAPPYLTDLSNR